MGTAEIKVLYSSEISKVASTILSISFPTDSILSKMIKRSISESLLYSCFAYEP